MQLRARPLATAGSVSRRSLALSTAAGVPRPLLRPRARRVVSARDSEEQATVIAFSIDELTQAELIERAKALVSRSVDELQNWPAKPAGANGRGHSNGNGRGNGHSSPPAEAPPRYQVVHASNGDAATSTTAAPGANGNGSSSGTRAPAASNGNGRAAPSAAPAPAIASNGRGSNGKGPQPDKEQQPSALARPGPQAAAAAAAEQAAAAWAAAVAAEALPGQQLSSSTYDCGVAVTISREPPQPAGGSSSSSDDEGAPAAAAASPLAGCYFVRVAVPPSFGRACVLHWGVDNWALPAKPCQPPHSEQHDERAVRTPFSPLGFTPVRPPPAPPAAPAPEQPNGGQAEAPAAPPAPQAGDWESLYPGVQPDAGSGVTLVFPEALCPERLVFVLHQADADAWVRDHGANFSLQLRSPCLNDLVEGVMAAEASYEHWGLLHRLQRVLELLDNAEAAGAAGMAFVFTWLRLSSNRLLDWQRCFSYQPRDITWAQQQVAERIADKARESADPAVRFYARMTLAKLSRGGGNGDEIRMGILNIMRDHGIKEGNRGGLDEPFLEQWHQKLHQATSPEDVVIAEAYLAFLHSANHEDWWRVLQENGLSQERLESWEQPITALPMHLPQLIPAIQHYHWVLKTCHAGAELDTALTCAQGFVDPDLKWHLHDLAANRNAWWAPGKTLELRRRLKPYWQAPGSSRDLLLLDIALESWLRLLVERQDKRGLSGDDLVELMGFTLGNAALTGTSHELQLVAAQWEAVRAAPERWSRAWCLAAAAALGRVTLALSSFADDICGLIQPYAELFGLRCGLPTSHILNFSEEVVRDQALFVGSLLAAELEPRLRTAAGASSWQVVSQVPSAVGEVVLLPDLQGVQGVAFERPTVVLARALGGMEDIPDGVVGLLTRAATDVLSHVAIRARTQGVLMAGCADDEEWSHLVELEGQQVSLSVASSGDVIATSPTAADLAAASRASPAPAAAAAAAGPAAGAGADGSAAASPGQPGAEAVQQLPGANWRALGKQPGGFAASLRVLQEAEFSPEVVGAKACNLATLRSKLPDWILVPRSVALPFGSFEAALADPANADVAAALGAIEAKLAAALGSSSSGSSANANGSSANGSSSGAALAGASLVPLLSRARELVESQLKPPAGMQRLVYEALVQAELLPSPGSSSSGSSGSSSSSSERDDASQPQPAPAPEEALPAAEPGAPAAPGAPGSLSQRQHQRLLALPVGVGSGRAWDPADPGCPAWSACWAAICGVWASKWNHRAWLSRRSAGLPEEQLAVSVLLQQVLPGQYAFVLHTASPFSGARGEMYGELVCGLGETLVGNHPGRPLAFSDRPDGSDMQLLALPSKRLGLFAPPEGTLIARSDTNGEDLAGYAGAGLYDSIPATPLVPRCPDYASEPLMWDAPFRQQLLDGLVELGYAVESAFDGTPQDIEGVWLEVPGESGAGRFAVVQSRPQVMASCSGGGGAPSSAGRQRAKALAAAEAAEAAAAVAAVREASSSGPGMGGSGEWEWEREEEWDY